MTWDLRSICNTGQGPGYTMKTTLNQLKMKMILSTIAISTLPSVAAAQDTNTYHKRNLRDQAFSILYNSLKGLGVTREYHFNQVPIR